MSIKSIDVELSDRIHTLELRPAPLAPNFVPVRPIGVTSMVNWGVTVPTRLLDYEGRFDRQGLFNIRIDFRIRAGTQGHIITFRVIRVRGGVETVIWEQNMSDNWLTWFSWTSSAGHFTTGDTIAIVLSLFVGPGRVAIIEGYEMRFI